LKITSNALRCVAYMCLSFVCLHLRLFYASRYLLTYLLAYCRSIAGTIGTAVLRWGQKSPTGSRGGALDPEIFTYLFTCILSVDCWNDWNCGFALGTEVSNRV